MGMEARLWVRLPAQLDKALKIIAEQELLKPADIGRLAIKEYIRTHYPDLLANGNGLPCADAEKEGENG